MANFDIAFKKTMGFEGGYVDDKDDSGGETKYGISKKIFPNLNIRELTLNEAKDIYNKNYWKKIKGDKINDQHVANNIFDCSVNIGVGSCVKIVQIIVNVKDDGIIGSITLNAINSLEPTCLVNMIKLKRIEYYKEICRKKKQNRKFFFGWVKRTLEV